jgi:O-antigen/teichoic acid export membrane protein
MLGYTVVQYRLLGGGQAALGDYVTAGIVFLYTSTIAEWGLGTLLTRDVARGNHSEGGESHAAIMFGQTLALRLGISMALFVPVGIFIAVYLALFNLSAAGAWATLLLSLSLLPGAFSGSVTALLYAHERMSLPAAIGVGTSILNVVLGVGMLLLGWGVIGLAVAATLTTLFMAGVFWRVLRRDFPSIRLGDSSWRIERPSAMQLLGAGWPLMLNALLVGLFFRADVFIIRASTSTLEVERYDAAFKFLSFVLLITPAVTLALFPRMARHAEADRPRLLYEYRFALKVLLILSVPIVALTVWFAPMLIAIVTGGRPEYQPASAVALQILIFFLPLSFINGVTQYVLIALNLQRLITRAFAMTVTFNLAANLVLVPWIGINGAAIATIGSEIVLLLPFMLWAKRELGPIGLGALALKPALAALVVGAGAWLLWPLAQRWSAQWLDFALYVAAGTLLCLVYIAALSLMRPLTEGELNAIKGALRRRR